LLLSVLVRRLAIRRSSRRLQLTRSSARQSRHGERDCAIADRRQIDSQPWQWLDDLERRIRFSSEQGHIYANIKDAAGTGFI
jgi:hypothetical protein